MLCALCDSINVTDLILLAKANTGVSKADEKKWKHHSTYDDIVAAARAGCELCKLLVASLDRGLQRPPWHEVTYKEVLLESEREGLSTGFRVEIRGNESIVPEKNGSEILNAVCFGFGEHDDVPLMLSLQAPRGKGFCFLIELESSRGFKLVIILLILILDRRPIAKLLEIG
ncbi:hypothetical protein BofuT4_P056260.1 [Botrytis cinerea T4]|uniref:Uncharacterized protein n=1 Tax=Botryotinia fuckeliana (strain T4) TaxID=999810 RepID=G2XW55_BOTF4|nr:hypothetical protein BofuT4_P056260.1 [Botrytis cinerea T4]